MSRRMFAAGVLALLLAAPALAAQGDNRVVQIHAKGPGAVAFWTTFPESGVPEPNVVYTNTEALTGEFTYNEDGARYVLRFLDIDEFTYRFDEQGNLVPLSATNGVSEGPVTLAVDNRLRSASAQATIHRTSCTPHPNPAITPRSLILCGSSNDPVDAGTAPATVRWVATGETIGRRDHDVDASPCLTIGSHSRSRLRPASATATYGGQQLGATEDETYIFDEASLLLLVEHAPRSFHPVCFPPG